MGRWALAAFLLLWETGCGATFSRLPTLDYQHQARLEVRSDGEPMQLDVLRLGDEDEVVASCRGRCSIELPSGRYRLRAHGLAPTRERLVNVKETTRVAIRPGNSVSRGVGIGFTAVGGAASLAFAVPIMAPLCDEVNGDCGVRPWVYTGLGGLAVLTTGLVLMGTSRTTLDVSQTEPRAEPSAFIDARGFGLQF